MSLFRKLRPHILPASWFWITLLVAIALFGFSNAEAMFLGLFAAFYVLPVWLVVLAARLLVWWSRRRRGKGRVLSRPWLSWSIEPIVCALLVALISVGGLKWTRFVISYPWLHAKARAELANIEGDGPKEWHGYDKGVEICGLYRVKQWETGQATDGTPQFLIITADETITDAAGWAYVPSGAKPRGIKTGQPSYFDHMIGPWWRWLLDE